MHLMLALAFGPVLVVAATGMGLHLVPMTVFGGASGVAFFLGM
jgi:hypothetical protein